MSFEQLDNEKYHQNAEKKRLEKEKLNSFWLEKQIYSETSNLLHDLASKIAQEFGIDVSEVKELIKWDTLGDLDWLKAQVWSSEKINFIRLQQVLQDAHDSIEALSRNRRNALKASLEKNDYQPESHEYITTRKFLPQSLVQKAKNPQHIWDQCIGLGLGLIDSWEAVVVFSYKLWTWILLTPYHLYLLLTWKAKYKGFSKI